MKTQPQTASGLLRPNSSHVEDGAKVTIGPKSDSTRQAITVNHSELGVESIEVICPCGERIVIRCEYE